MGKKARIVRLLLCYLFFRGGAGGAGGFWHDSVAAKSDIRQVPDHQEVFVSKEGRVSIVIELLSFEENLPSAEDGASARHFFNDLGTANGASTSVCDFCADLSDR